MLIKKLTLPLISTFILSSCSPAQKTVEDAAVSDFDNDGLSDTLFAQDWLRETDIGIRYGKGAEQKIATFSYEKTVCFANVVDNNIEVWWLSDRKEGDFIYNITRFYNRGVSGDSVVFSLDKPSSM